MDGNEDSCTNCKQKMGKEETHFKCDLCVQKIHKNCASLSGSEIKCMPLQKRVLILLCNNCKMMLSKSQCMIELMEEMRNELTNLRKEVEILKTEISTKPDNEVCFNKTFSQVVLNSGKAYTKNSVQSPSLVIKPKLKQNSEKTRKDLKSKIQPSQLGIGIKNVRETKQGGIVVKCLTKSDVEKLKDSSEKHLGNNYIIEIPQLNLPKMKIVGYNGEYNIEELEQIIRQQNTWIEKDDKINLTYMKRVKRLNTSTIFFECCPKLYWKIMDQKKIFIGWERYVVYENLNISRCFKCQEYYHKSERCHNEQACEICAENHCRDQCLGHIKKCKNCVNANDKFKTEYNTDHAASDTECPSTKYHIDLLRSRTDYGK